MIPTVLLKVEVYMNEPVYLLHWVCIDQYAILVYSDNTVFSVLKSDFDRAFGAIVSGSKEDIYRDFALK